MQKGIPYILTGPSGQRAVFNNSSDPDFCGYLDQDNGITGLLDSADVRQTVDPKVEGDGEVQGDSFFSGRVGTIQGIVWPDPDWTTMNQRESKIKQASRAMKASAPSILNWQPDGRPMLRMRLYRQSRVAFTQRRPQQFQIAMSSPDPFILSDSLQSQTVLPSGTSGADLGFSSPFTDPFSSLYNVQAQQFVVNQGDAPTWPIFTWVGPITNPGVINNTTGQKIVFATTLQATDTLYVDAQSRLVLINNTPHYSAYAANFSTNTWFQLQPGNNDLRLLSTAWSSGAQMTVQWRHAWE